MRSWIEIATRTVTTETSVHYQRNVVADVVDGPRLRPAGQGNWDSVSVPAELGEAQENRNQKQSKFINVMLSLTVAEARLMLGAVEPGHGGAAGRNGQTDERALRPIAKELASALGKAEVQQAQIRDNAMGTGTAGIIAELAT